MRERDDVDDPLARLYDATDDDGEVTVDAVTLDEAEFRERLTAVADAAEVIDDLASDARALRRSGLRDSDVRDLIYGRNRDLTKGDVAAVLDGLDDLAGASSRRRSDLFIRLLADVSDLTISDTKEIVDELRSLHERYPPEGDDDA